MNKIILYWFCIIEFITFRDSQVEFNLGSSGDEHEKDDCSESMSEADYADRKVIADLLENSRINSSSVLSNNQILNKHIFGNVISWFL